MDKGTILVVEDEPNIADLVDLYLSRDGYRVVKQATGEGGLAAVRDQRPRLVVLDVGLPDIDGLEVCRRIRATSTLPVIFLTGHGDVPTAVAAVKRGAFDFVEKPFSDNALVDRVVQALEVSGQAILRRRGRRALQRALADLTEREREVMERVVAGLANKLIADALDISVRTVEVHRARMFEKMNVRSAVELANLLRDHAP